MSNTVTALVSYTVTVLVSHPWQSRCFRQWQSWFLHSDSPGVSYSKSPLVHTVSALVSSESRDSSVVERQTRDGKFSGLNPGRRTFFPWSIFCADSYFAICLTPHVTAVARKRTRSFCQKCRWQVTTKHACTLCVPMPTCAYVALNDDTTVTGAWFYGVHRTCAETATVSHGTSHVTTKPRCNHFGEYSERAM